MFNRTKAARDEHESSLLLSTGSNKNTTIESMELHNSSLPEKNLDEFQIWHVLSVNNDDLRMYERYF